MGVYYINTGDRKAGTGSCLIKSIAHVYDYYKYNVNTWDILALTGVLETACEENGKFHITDDRMIMHRINEVLPIKFNFLACKDEEEARELLLTKIKAGHPVVVMVHLYYVSYTPDYLKVPETRYATGHLMTIVGVDEEKEEYILADPTYDKFGTRISYRELMDAWSDPKDVSTMPHYTYGICEGNLDGSTYQTELKALLKASIEKNIEYFLEEEKGDAYDKTVYFGKLAIQEGLNILRELDEVYTPEIGAWLKERYEVIFFGLRWTRKMFSELLVSERFAKIPEFQEISKQFEVFYDRWTVIGQKLLRMYTKQSSKHVKKVVDQAMAILEDEKEVILKLREINMRYV